MKNRYITSWLLASSSLLFTACCEDHAPVNTTLTDQSISFAPYIEQTRARVADVTTLKTDGFRVWISHNNGDTFNRETDDVSYLYNEDVQFSMPLDAWDYTNKRFWPTDEAKLSFFALANGGNYLITEHTKSSVGAPVYTFETPVAISDQVDLLAAQDLDKVKTTNKVSFNFQHMLSKITFTAHADLPENSSATLKKVEVFYAAGKLHNKAEIDLNDLDVDVVSSAYYTSATAISAGILYEDQTGMLLTSTPQPLSASTSDYLMLVPQIYDQGDIYLSVSYELNTDDNGHYGGDGPSFKEVHTDQHILLPVCVNEMGANIGWQKGSQYTYQIEISAETVGFSKTIRVTDWNTPVNQAVEEKSPIAD